MTTTDVTVTANGSVDVGVALSDDRVCHVEFGHDAGTYTLKFAAELLDSSNDLAGVVACALIALREHRAGQAS